MADNMNVLMHNMTAMFSNRQLGITNTNRAKSTEKLSSGYKINRAADDAAGLTISEKLRSQVRGLHQAAKNINDGIDYVKVADGALEETSEMLQRMNELVIKSANDTNTEQDRIAIDEEIKQLRTEMNRVFASTEFNTKKIWDPNTLETKEIDTITGYHKVRGVSIPEMSVSGIVTNENRNEFPRNGFLISADRSGLQVSWTAYSGKEYKSNKISWPSGDPPASATFELKDFLDTAKYPKLNGINAKFGYTVESSEASIDDVIAMMDGQYIGNSIYHTEKMELFGISESDHYSDKIISTGVSIGYDALIVADRDFESADTSYIRAYPTNYSNFVFPESDDDPFVFTFEMDGIGTVKAVSSSIYYYANDRDDESRDVFWRGYDDVYNSVNNSWRSVYKPDPQSYQYKDGVRYYENANLGGLKNIYNKTYASLQNGQGTKYSKEGGYICVSFDLVADNPYHNGSSIDSTSIGRMGLKITSTNSDTADSIEGVLRTLGGIDIYNSNSSGNTDEGEATPVRYSATWDARTGGDIQVPEHTYTYETTRRKLEVPIQSGTFQGQEIDLVYDYLDANVLGVDDVSALTRESSLNAIDKIQNALDIVVGQRSQFGAYQNRLEHAYNINNNVAENTDAAESLIRDTDMAEEMVRFTKEGILQQAGQSMLAQANQNRQGLLSLLQ